MLAALLLPCAALSSATGPVVSTPPLHSRHDRRLAPTYTPPVRWDYVKLPDWHIEAMSIFLLRELQAEACPGSRKPACAIVAGALPTRVTRAKRRMLQTLGEPAMIEYRIDTETSRGVVTYTVLEQAYSHTLQLKQALVYRPEGTLASMVGKEHLDVLDQPLELDASAFATLQAEKKRIFSFSSSMSHPPLLPHVGDLIQKSPKIGVRDAPGGRSEGESWRVDV